MTPSLTRLWRILASGNARPVTVSHTQHTSPRAQPQPDKLELE
jgi:hypothetical protein